MKAAKPASRRRAPKVQHWGSTGEADPTTVDVECGPDTAQVMWVATRRTGFESRVYLTHLADAEKLHAQLTELIATRRAELAALERLDAEHADTTTTSTDAG